MSMQYFSPVVSKESSYAMKIATESLPVASQKFFTHKACFHINGLVQYYSDSSALSVELLQSCAKPSISCWPI